MTPEDFKDSVRRLRNLIADKHFAEALQLVQDLLKTSPGSVSLLIKRAMLIQLQDKEANLPPLEAVRENLEYALEVEPDSVDVQIELGNYEYAVANDPESALGRFEQATSCAEVGLKAALIGLAKCQMELGRSGDFLATLERAKSIFPDDLDVQILEDEFTD